MSRRLLIRCKFEGSIEQAQQAIGKLFNVEMRFVKTPVGDSYLFSAMGVDAAFYEFGVGDYVQDRRLVDYHFVLDVVLYATLMGRMYSEIDALHQITLFLASFISSKLRWPTMVCTEEEVVMDELDP